MNLNFMNQNLEEKPMVDLADLQVLDQNFCMNGNVDQNEKTTATRKNYSPTEVKAKNFLRNLSYKRLAKNDFVNKFFLQIVLVSF